MRPNKHFRKIFKIFRLPRKSAPLKEDSNTKEYRKSEEKENDDRYGEEKCASSTHNEKDVKSDTRKENLERTELNHVEKCDQSEEEKVSIPFEGKNVSHDSGVSTFRVKNNLDDTEKSQVSSTGKRRLSLTRRKDKEGTLTDEGIEVPGSEAHNESGGERKRRTSLFGEEMDDAVWKMFGNNGNFGSSEFFESKSERPKRSLSLFSKSGKEALAGTQWGSEHCKHDFSGKRRISLFQQLRSQNNESAISDGTKRKRRISLFRLGEKNMNKKENQSSENGTKNDSGKKTFKEEIQQALLELLQDDMSSSSSDAATLNKNDGDNISFARISEHGEKIDANNQSEKFINDSCRSSFRYLDADFAQLDEEASEIMKSIRNETFGCNKGSLAVCNYKPKGQEKHDDDGIEDEILKLESISIALREEIEQAEAFNGSE